MIISSRSHPHSCFCKQALGPTTLCDFFVIYQRRLSVVPTDGGTGPSCLCIALSRTQLSRCVQQRVNDRLSPYPALWILTHLAYSSVILSLFCSVILFVSIIRDGRKCCQGMQADQERSEERWCRYIYCTSSLTIR